MQRSLPARGRTKHVSMGRPITPSEAIDCGSHRARETPPFRPLAIQIAGVHRSSSSPAQRTGAAGNHRDSSLVVTAAAAEGLIQSCGGRGFCRTDESRIAVLRVQTSECVLPLLPQLGRRLLDTRPVLSSLGIASRRRPPVCARDDRHSARVARLTLRARVSCRACVLGGPANSWPWADCE
jgi:hypothetical protein